MLLKDAHRVLLKNREKMGWEKGLSDVNSARGNCCHAAASGDVPISTALPPRFTAHKHAAVSLTTLQARAGRRDASPLLLSLGTSHHVHLLHSDADEFTIAHRSNSPPLLHPNSITLAHCFASLLCSA
jgi:hypothetical protein